MAVLPDASAAAPSSAAAQEYGDNALGQMDVAFSKPANVVGNGTGAVAPEKNADGGSVISQPPSAPEDLGRKIIREGSASLETIEFKKTINALYAMVKDMGGFMESQTIQGGRYNYSSLQSATITVRVPSARFDDAMFGLSSLGTVVQQSTNGTDITDQYTDSQSRVRNLKIQETRILELIMKAQKLDEIVVLEQRLSDLRYQIESLENSLKNYDRMLEYSRISLQISEVVKESDMKPVPKTLGERLAQAFNNAWTGFVEGLQDLMVWLVRNLFTLLILALIAFVILSVLRARSRKRKGIESAGRRRKQTDPTHVELIGKEDEEKHD